MIPIIDFAPNPLRQLVDGLCIQFSYACAVYPLTKVPEQEVLNALDAFITSHQPNVNGALGLPQVTSGYNIMEALHNQCTAPCFNLVRRLVELRRVRNALHELQTNLQNNRATAILALSFATGRNPHSVAIACDATRGFFIRDSARPNRWNIANLAADAIGNSVVEAVANLDATAIPGEAIVFLEKAIPCPNP